MKRDQSGRTQLLQPNREVVGKRKKRLPGKTTILKNLGPALGGVAVEMKRKKRIKKLWVPLAGPGGSSISLRGNSSLVAKGGLHGPFKGENVTKKGRRLGRETVFARSQGGVWVEQGRTKGTFLFKYKQVL